MIEFGIIKLGDDLATSAMGEYLKLLGFRFTEINPDSPPPERLCANQDEAPSGDQPTSPSEAPIMFDQSTPVQTEPNPSPPNQAHDPIPIDEDLQKQPEAPQDVALKTTTSDPDPAAKTAEALGEDKAALEVFILAAQEWNKNILRLLHHLRQTPAHKDSVFVLVTPEIPPQLKPSLCEESGVAAAIGYPVASGAFISEIQKLAKESKLTHEVMKKKVRIFEMLATPGKADEALSEIELLAALNATPPFYMQYLRAVALEKMKKYREAIKAAANSTKLNPNFLSGWSILAKCYHHTKDNESAKQILMRALKIAEEHVDYLVQLGDIHFEEGKFDKSERFYRRALKVEPDNKDARAGVVATSLATGQQPSDEDLAYFPSAFDLARVSNLKGVQLAHAEQYTSAQKLYENALIYLPIRDQAHRILFNLGLLMERWKKYEDALKYYEESLARAGQSPLPKLLEHMEKLRHRNESKGDQAFKKAG